MAIAIGLLKTLLEVARARKCGAVEASAHGARVRIFVDQGVIVFAAEGGVGETLGRILVRERVLSDDQYVAAIEWTADLRARGYASRLGEVLVELGFLTPEQLFAALSAQVREKVVNALGWTGPRVVFLECHGALDIAARHPTPLEPLVLAALRLADTERVDELFDQARSRFVGLRSDRAARAATFERLASLRMHGEEDAFARSLDGASTLDELLEEPSSIDRRVVLAALLLTDCLDFHATPQAPRDKPVPKPRPPRPRRSLPPPSERKPSVHPVKPKRRSSVHPPPDDNLSMALKVASRLRDVRESRRELTPTTGPVSSRELPTTARLLAEKAFQRGRRLVRANQLEPASTELRRAMALFAAPEYAVWAAWAALRTDPSRRELHAEELGKAAERALAQDPSFGFGYFALGYLALREGEAIRAKVLFDRARELDPETVDGATDVRLRDGSLASSATRGELRTLAPLLTASQPELVAAKPHGAAASPAAHAAPAPVPESAPKGEDITELDEDDDVVVVGSAPTASRPKDAKVDRPEARASKPPALPKARRAAATSSSAAATTVDGDELPARGKTGAIVGLLAIAAVIIVVFRSAPSAPPAEPEVTAGAGVVTRPVETAEPEPASSAPPPETSATVTAGGVTPTDSGGGDDDAQVTEVTEVEEADAATPDADAEPAIGPTVAVLDLPAAANGHRVFVDGRVVGEPPAIVRAPCGKHTIKVGSRGRDQLVDVACGAHVAVTYP